MKSNVKNKNFGKKLRNRLKGQQKLSLKVIVFFSVCSSLIVIILVSFFNITSVLNSKANNIEVIQIDEQVFSNELSLPKPQINLQKKTGPNSVLIQQKRHE